MEISQDNNQNQTNETKMSITIETIHEHLTYEYEVFYYDDAWMKSSEPQKGRLTVSWDYENEEIDTLMGDEFRGRLDQMGRKNLMWIEEVKNRANWKKGETLTLMTKSNCDGCCYVWWYLDKRPIVLCDVMIEPNGYAVLQHLNHYTYVNTYNPYVLMIRSESVYNDNVYEAERK